MKKQSSAMKLISHVWSHKQEGTSHSWERINSAMQAAVKLAITAGLKFAKGDFERIAETMRIHYWSNTEQWYGMAINFGNASAVASIEKWKDRKPFLIRLKENKHATPSKTRRRLYVDARFFWKDNYVKVTSFASDQSHIVACGYSGRNTPSRRFKISHEDIVAYHSELRAAERAAEREARGEAA